MTDIYSAPNSALTEPVVAGAYGSLERGIAGDYQFSIRATLGEAWEKTKGAKGAIFLALLLYVVILVGISIALGLVMAPAGAGAGLGMQIGQQAITQLLTTAISMPMMGGLFIIGLRRAVDAPIQGDTVLKYFHKMLPLLGMTLLMYVLLILGYLLLILPGIYLSVAYYLALPLMVEKNLGAWQALEASRKAVSKRWFSVFGFFLLLALLNIATVFTLFIGMIWTMPMTVIAGGILYRNIFGIEPATLNPPAAQNPPATQNL